MDPTPTTSAPVNIPPVIDPNLTTSTADINVVLPAPPETVIVTPDAVRDSMDKYVLDDFPAHLHGYNIRIGHSSTGICHYECSRSGFAPTIPGGPPPQRSLRIGCPFEVTARLVRQTIEIEGVEGEEGGEAIEGVEGEEGGKVQETFSWHLIHTHLGHNHLPDPKAKPRKRRKKRTSTVIPQQPPVAAPPAPSTSLDPLALPDHPANAPLSVQADLPAEHGPALAELEPGPIPAITEPDDPPAPAEPPAGVNPTEHDAPVPHPANQAQPPPEPPANCDLANTALLPAERAVAPAEPELAFAPPDDKAVPVPAEPAADCDLADTTLLPAENADAPAEPELALAPADDEAVPAVPAEPAADCDLADTALLPAENANAPAEPELALAPADDKAEPDPPQPPPSPSHSHGSVQLPIKHTHPGTPEALDRMSEARVGLAHTPIRPATIDNGDDDDVSLRPTLALIKASLKALTPTSRQLKIQQIELILNGVNLHQAGQPQTALDQANDKPHNISVSPPRHSQDDNRIMMADSSFDKLVDEFYGPVSSVNLNSREEAPTSNILTPLQSTSTSTQAEIALAGPQQAASTCATALQPNRTPPLSPAPLSEPSKASNRKPKRQSKISNAPASPAGVTNPRVTRQRAREQALSTKPALTNPALPALLRKYHIDTYLHPFISDLHEVLGDGHCGFRAVSVAIGRSQDDWIYVRERMEETLEKYPEVFTDRNVPDTDRAEAFARLRTTKSNVVREPKYWLTMPGWGGIIATTFDRPVLFYDPNDGGQTSFPYLTGENNNPPIILTWCTQHYCALTMDFTLPNFPAPKLSPNWRRHHLIGASNWLTKWLPMTETGEKLWQSHHNKTRSSKRHKKNTSEPMLISD